MPTFCGDELGRRRGRSLVVGSLVLCAALLWSDAAWSQQPPKRKDPCEEILATPGRGGTATTRIQESLGETIAKQATNPLSATTGVAGDYYLDPAAVEMLPEGGRRLVCWMSRYEKTLRDMTVRLGYLQNEMTYRCVPPKTGRAADAEKDRQVMQGYVNRMPSHNEPRGGHPRGSGGWIWAYMWEVRDYTNTAEFKRVRTSIDQIKKNTLEYEKDVQPCAQMAAGQGPTKSQREYSVWLAGNDVLVGQSDVLRETPACRLKGWGTNCEVTVGKALQSQGKDLQRIATLYNSFEEARAVYCASLNDAKKSEDTAPRAVPLTGGRDWTAKLGIAGGDRVGISNAPQCGQ